MFPKILGQQRLKNLLTKAIEGDKISHAYLFVGESGTGKKTFATTLAKAIFCTGLTKPCDQCAHCRRIDCGNEPDFINLEAKKGESTIKIAAVRSLIQEMSKMPFNGRLRIIMINDAQRMPVEAQNAILKTLEEPKPKNLFLLTTDTPKLLLDTLRSRCQILEMEALPSEVILKELVKKGIDSTAAQVAVTQAGGSLGKAIALVNDPNKTLKEQSLKVILSILTGNPIPLFSFCESLGKNKEQSQIVIDYLLDYFLKMGIALATGIPSQEMLHLYNLLDTATNEVILKTLFELKEHLNYNINQRLGWETAFLKIYQIQEKP